MNVKSNDRPAAGDLGDAIRELRRTAGLTQAQLAVAIGIAPTSIYRYEAGLTKPDVRTVQKLFVFADKHQDEVAKSFFREELEGSGDLIITGREGSALRLGVKDQGPSSLEWTVGSQPLTPQEQILAIAFVLMLRNNADESSEKKMMKLLLDPWMKAAKDLLEQP
jgi:transcriptional regulator with XRE-family HTH domain